MPLPDDCCPDFYIAAMGRSGSTMLCDWLSTPPGEIVLSEPFFFSEINPTMLRIQLENFGYMVSDEAWSITGESWSDRFGRLFEPFLRGRKWGFKEVLASEHRRVMQEFLPGRVVCSVRDIRDIAASFLEKHKIQQNLDRFDHQWVEDYCLTQSRQLVEFCHQLTASETPFRIQRYEDFLRSETERAALAQFVGWQGRGETGRHHDRLDRGFEVQWHGRSVGDQRPWQDRALTAEERRLAQDIADQCTPYQQFFGYA